MGRVVISHTDETSPHPFPALAGLVAEGGIESRGVIAQDDRSLRVWVHQLQPGAEMRFAQPPVGHALYVWEGSVTARADNLHDAGAMPGIHVTPDHLVMDAGTVFTVEHKGAATLRAGPTGARIVHYHQREDAAPLKGGGHVHAIGRNGAYKGYGAKRNGTHTMWMEASCPTCGLWLHKSSFGTAFPQGGPHYHTEDEIIFVVEGGAMLGRKTHPPGTALAIDANTVYGFGVAEGGMAFLNFRASEPSVVMMTRDGPDGPARKERDAFRSFPPATAGAS